MFRLKNAVVLAILGSLLILTPGLSQTSNVAERFSGFDPDSKIRINHQPLTDNLSYVVLPVGRSYQILGNEKPTSYKASRIKTTKSLSPSRFEGNRLLFSSFSDGYRVFFKAYQEGLELLSNRRPLKEFNKNEQLAYWLNLYNVIVINKLADEYPISKLKSLRSSKRGKKSFWTKKITTVEGVSLSLTDIEKILFANFDAPEVAFGLWQGSIGGPRLSEKAYTGGNVLRTLERNAVEFVNSNRGLRPPTGTRMNVSKFYEWVMPAFGTSEEHVLMFIKEYADPNFVSGVSSLNTLNFKLYDWTIADLMGGTLHSGTKSQLGGVLTGRSKIEGSKPAGPSGGGGGVGGLMDFYKMTASFQRTGPFAEIPDVAYKLLLSIVQNTRRPMPIITTEECAPGDPCKIENVNIDDR